MDFPVYSDLYKKITGDFETAYTMFLLEQRWMKTPATRVLFYAACEKMVKENPIPGDPIIQLAILQHLHEQQTRVVDEYTDDIEKIFNDVAVTNNPEIT